MQKRRQFLAVAQSGKKQIGRLLALSYLPKDPGSLSRIGLTVTKQWGKAHMRNRIKRQLREAYRHVHPHLSPGFDIVVKPRKFAHFSSFKEIADELWHLLTCLKSDP